MGCFSRAVINEISDFVVKIWLRIDRRSAAMSTTLPLFWDLSSVEKKKRLDASVKLISTLEKFQGAFERRSAESDASSNEDDSGREEDMQGVGNLECDSMLDVLNAPDVAYSIRRLVRGLGSPRESSRLGFAVALTEVRAKLQMYIRLMVEIPRAALPYNNCFLRANFGASPRCHSNVRQPNRPRGARLAFCSPFWSHRNHSFRPTPPHTPSASSFSVRSEYPRKLRGRARRSTRARACQVLACRACVLGNRTYNGLSRGCS
jgi:hypothetical protein